MKRQLEFFAADAMAWREAEQPGTEEKVLSRDADDPAVLTRLVRWVPGLGTTRAVGQVCPTAPTARPPAAPCSKSGTASPHDELVGSAVTGVAAHDGALWAKLTHVPGRADASTPLGLSNIPGCVSIRQFTRPGNSAGP